MDDARRVRDGRGHRHHDRSAAPRRQRRSGATGDDHGGTGGSGLAHTGTAVGFGGTCRAGVDPGSAASSGPERTTASGGPCGTTASGGPCGTTASCGPERTTAAC